MKIFTILKKEILQSIREPRNIIFMILVPICLILILSAVFSKHFDSNSDFKDVNLLYTFEDNANNDAFESFLDTCKKLNITLIKEDNIQHGIGSVKGREDTAYVLFRNESDKIEFYKNDKNSFKADLIETLLRAFVQKFNIFSAINEISETAEDKVLQYKDMSYEYTKEEPIQGSGVPSSKDYYSVSMITVIILFSMMTGAFAFKGEKTTKTGIRIAITPIKNYEVIIGKILGSFISTAFQISILLLFTKYVLKTFWGPNIGSVVILLASEIVMATSAGMLLSFFVKNDMALLGVISGLANLFAFIGGGFIPIDSFNGVASIIAYSSPVKWNSQAIFGIIYSNNTSFAFEIIAVNLVIATIAIIIGTFKFRREVATV